MSDAHAIADQAERDLAATDLGTTYIVEAAAGTGKTTLLVDRILSIIVQKEIPLAHVVAITFTEKAAGDLKIKLRKKLEERAQQDSHHAYLFRRALLELDAMPVSTIHSFCRELIQERPVEAGVDPGFAVADQTTADLLREELWEEWLAREFSAECPAARPFLERDIPVVADRGFSLRDVYDELLERREDLAELRVVSLSDEELRESLRQFADALREDLTVLTSCRDPEDSLSVELRKISDWIDRLPDVSITAPIEWLENPPTIFGARGQQANWVSKEDLEHGRSLRKSFAGRVSGMYGHVVSRWGRDLVEWLKGAVTAYANAKAQRGLLDFQDLLLIARNLLRDSRAARDFFKRRFSYILVDEFQDTDPLQAEIVFYLAERADSFAERWEDVALAPGKLFIVGDPKQSIYRFRRADLDIYGQVRAKVETGGQCLHIRVNFRSAPDILHEVNDIFAPQMTGPRNGRYEPEYVPLEAYHDGGTGVPPTVFLTPPENWWERHPPAKEQARAEAACIAEFVRDVCAIGTHSYRDVGILYPATTYLLELESALRAREIPYQVAGGKKLTERSEVMALRTVIAALDNPYDEMSVVGALRSSFLACSDEDLFEQRINAGGFNYAREAGKVAHVEACFAILRDLHRNLSQRLPSETLAELFERTRGLQIFALKPQGDARVANLLKLLDMARSLEETPDGSFHRFAQRLAQGEEARIGEEDSVTAETGDDVVQLLTFHKAKGLEFPVVILYRLGQNREQKDTVLVRRDTKTVDFSAKAEFQTAGFAASRADEEDRAQCEALRLLYVALTRAKERLVIPAYWAEQNRGFYEFLRARYAGDGRSSPACQGTRFQIHDTSRYSLETPPVEALKIELDLPESSPEVQTSLAQRAEWKARRMAAAGALNREAGFKTPSGTEIGVRSSAPTKSVQTAEAQSDALQFGKYVHRLLERVDLPQGANLDSEAQLAAAEFNVNPVQVSDGCEWIRRALASPLFRRLDSAQAVYRELPFTYLENNVLWEGAMDLVFVEDGELIVVDFKTDRVTPESIETLAAAYAPQMQAYHRALEKITGNRVRERLIYFLRAERVVAVDKGSTG